MFASAAAASAADCAWASAALICPTWLAAACWASCAALIWASLGLTGAAEAAPGATPRQTVSAAAVPTRRVAQRLTVRRPVPTCVLTCVRTDPTPPLPGARVLSGRRSRPVPAPRSGVLSRGHRPDRLNDTDLPG